METNIICAANRDTSLLMHGDNVLWTTDRLTYVAPVAKDSWASGHCPQLQMCVGSSAAQSVARLFVTEILQHEHNLRCIEARHIGPQPLPRMDLIVQLACRVPGDVPLPSMAAATLTGQ